MNIIIIANIHDNDNDNPCFDVIVDVTVMSVISNVLIPLTIPNAALPPPQTDRGRPTARPRRNGGLGPGGDGSQLHSCWLLIRPPPSRPRPRPRPPRPAPTTADDLPAAETGAR